MALLTPDEKKRIGAAVAAAEANTGGEIVTAVIPESDDYAARELVFAGSVAALAFLAAAFATPRISLLLDQWFWTASPALLPLAVGLVALTAGALAYVLAQIPALDRLIVGKRAMAEAVRLRAMRHFAESAAYDTVDRTGVLLFLSALERRVELVADKGINDAVAPDTWDRIVSALVRGMKDGRTAEALEKAVGDIGAVLAEHVPRRDDDENELADGPTELGRGS